MRTFHPALSTSIAMLAFAGNSLLCRVALRNTAIDPGSFAILRIVSGALMLWLIVRSRAGAKSSVRHGNWASALALFAYAATFSYAYVSLPTGTGALLLFGAVQATMIGFGVWRGERMGRWQILGLTVASAGLIGLLLPGLSAPPLASALLMLVAGIAWGIYSLRGKGTGDPAGVTAGNFIRATVPALLLLLLLATWRNVQLDRSGILIAIASGALTSGLGYIVWYTALRSLRPTTASTVQLSVPVIAAIGGTLLLAEPMTLRLVMASSAILGGIALVILSKPEPQ